MSDRQLVWFRNDLRTTDQIALSEAAQRGPVVAVYCFCPGQFAAHDVGGNRVAFTLAHVAALGDELEGLGIALRIIEAEVFDDLPAALLALAQEVDARCLWFNDEYPLNEQRRDDAVEAVFRDAGLAFERRTDSVVRAPGTVRTNDGGIYTVFTPFRRRWTAQFDASAARPRARPSKQAPLPISRDAVPPLPDAFTATADLSAWGVGEASAQGRLGAFVADRIERYGSDRDLPAVDGTSTLSPYLSLGVLSVRTCLDAALNCNDGRLEGGSEAVETWISELLWREFYRHVLATHPHLSRGHAFRREYDDFPWRHDQPAFDAWCEGRTGVPIVDAAMRQLRSTGWMHNRLRMVVAMFLSKNLLLDWRRGEAYFMHHLLDGDFAANNGGWQWSASTGTDAAPYFRIFNPLSQSARFDADGVFIRRHVPELDGIAARALHDPGRLPPELDYPAPIVDVKTSRQRAIDAFKAHAGR